MKKNKIRLHKVVKDLVDRDESLDYTNPEIQKNIENYGVLVDGTLVVNRLEWILPNQTIELNSWPIRDHGDFSKIKILFEDESLLLIFKPQGIVVQEGSGHRTHNLVNWLRDNYEHQLSFDLNEFPSGGLVNRIDKNTQGLVLVAKSPELKKFYQDQFRARKVSKKYLTVVEGTLEQKIQITAWQSRSKKDPVLQKLFWSQQEAINYDPNSRYTESVFDPIYICEEMNQTLVEVTIKTGRMHQIRLHAQEVGYPLVAETKYNLNREKDLTDLNPQQANPQTLTKEEFKKIQVSIFGDTEFCLLSNYIKIKLNSGQDLVYEYKKVTP